MDTQTSATPIQTFEELYNILMWEIEPELTTEVLPDLDDLYKNETPEERAMRFDWYGEAFRLFEESYATFMKKCHKEIGKIQKEIMKIGKAESAKEDATAMNSIEQFLDAA